MAQPGRYRRGAVQQRLWREYTRVSEGVDARRCTAEQGLIHPPSTQAEFATRVVAESVRWAQIIREQNIRLE